MPTNRRRLRSYALAAGLLFAACGSESAIADAGQSTSTTTSSLATTSTTPAVDDSALQSLISFIERNKVYSDENGRISDVFPEDGSREYPALSIALGHWTDGSAQYVTFDLSYGCSRWPGLLETTPTGEMQWRYGGPPPGIGVEDSLADCDLDLSTFPEIFDQFKSESRSTGIGVTVVDDQTILVEVDDFSQSFSS